MDVVVGRNADHIELLSAEAAREPFERTHLDPARIAPTGPHVDDQGLSAKLRQLAEIAGKSRQIRLAKNTVDFDLAGGSCRCGCCEDGYAEKKQENGFHRSLYRRVGIQV